jgi:hypothetical protein
VIQTESILAAVLQERQRFMAQPRSPTRMVLAGSGLVLVLGCILMAIGFQLITIVEAVTGCGDR